MNLSKQFLLSVFCVLPFVASAQVATTAGSNLTAWNGNAGATNNNNWNQLMNSRSGTASGAKADFGNCNSLILRCAQPKCAACSSMELAKPVVAGCVNSNKTCKKHGDDLIEFIAAQIVANAAQKQQQQEMQIQAQAAQQAAAQNSAQVQQLQSQIQQMQSSMQQQNATQMAQMQAALDEQKELVRQAQNEAAAAQRAKNDAQNAQSASSGVTVAQQKAIDSGVSEEILLRQQASGEILTSVDNAEMSLKSMKATLQDLFDYAGCDSRGGNCYGPKRVKVFKDKARPVFEEFNNVIDELYEALETSLMLGVDVSDVLMMLSGSCNRWARYMCHSNGTEKGSDDTERAVHKVARYNSGACTTSSDGKCCTGGMVPNSCVNGRSQPASCTDTVNGDSVTYTVKGGQDCTPGGVVPPADDALCTAIGTISADDSEDVQRQWVDENYDGDRMIRVGCLSNQLDSLALFGGRRRKKASTLDLDTLERILEQDAHDIGTSSLSSSETNTEKFKYCGLTTDGHKKLEKAIRTNKFNEADVCMESEKLGDKIKGGFVRSVVRDYFPDKIPNVDQEECESKYEKKAFWSTGGCMVRYIADGNKIKLKDYEGDCAKRDAGNSPYKTCGTFNYWDKDSDKVEKVSGAEDQCQLHRGQWLNKDDIKNKTGYKMPDNEQYCCICARNYEDCILGGKVCEKTKNGTTN